MKKGFLSKAEIAVGLFTAVLVSALPLSGMAWGAIAVPPPALVPLNQVAVPEPPNLFQFVKSKPAAIKLGKALFWDMQVGSDGVTACASCHFHAGADNRLKNTVHPGPNGAFDVVAGPNQTVLLSAFPFHQRSPADFQASAIVRDADDVVGSQGVRLAQFVGIDPDDADEIGTTVPDPVFNVGGVNMRRVTGRNTPSNINAVFNFNNFWDGRAHFTFNGVNPFGPADLNAGIWVNEAGTLMKRPVALQFASLASQAVGPPLNDVEMSFSGRTFPQLGMKMLGLTPLGRQLVHPGDSVLGVHSKAALLPNGTVADIKGLNTTYSQMIRDAFQDRFWNSAQSVALPEGSFTQMAANFSFFWGLAIQLYEATLVSDQTPFDRFLGGDETALTDQQQHGFNIFFGAGRCSICHTATEQTAASVGNARFLTNADNALIEQMTVADGTQVIYDDGYNNISVRPTFEDFGRGGTMPFFNPLTNQPFPLSFSALAELQARGLLPFSSPILPDFLPANFPLNVNGAFKAPSLRNVELTAPYFHNGSVGTIEQVVQFYTRGGNFPFANARDLDVNIAEIGQLKGAPDKQAQLVSFLRSMTDERVRNESAPFDHPELLLANGDPEVIKIPARDANGTAAVTLSGTFADVPFGAFGFDQVEAIASAGITGGCSATPPLFCPNDPITRAQMAVFIETSLGATPAVCQGTVFADVNPLTVGQTVCRFIEDFAARGITGGCGGGNFCPNDPVTRAQMAVFIEAALGNPANACAGNVFADVNAATVGATVCGFIERLAADGITGGCGGGNFCPGSPVTRTQMAVFIVAAPPPLMP